MIGPYIIQIYENMNYKIVNHQCERTKQKKMHINNLSYLLFDMFIWCSSQKTLFQSVRCENDKRNAKNAAGAERHLFVWCKARKMLIVCMCHTLVIGKQLVLVLFLLVVIVCCWWRPWWPDLAAIYRNLLLHYHREHCLLANDIFIPGRASFFHALMNANSDRSSPTGEQISICKIYNIIIMSASFNFVSVDKYRYLI